MNQREWKQSGKFLGKYEWYNKARKLQRSLQFNTDETATVIHHLRDTEEQRKYNDEHYELWGHNLDGTFEYGKYVIFVTEEWHCNYHHSEETRKRLSESNKAFWNTDEGRQILSEKSKKCWANDEYRNKLITKMNSDEAKARRAANKDAIGKKISESKKGYHHTEEAKQKMSKSHLGKHGMCGEVHPNFGKPAHNKGVPMYDEAKRKSREKHLGKSSAYLKACQILYKAYKQGNGVLSWNDFQKCISNGYISFERLPITVYINCRK